MRHLTWEGTGYGDLPYEKKDKEQTFISPEDFNRAREALRKAHTPVPYKAIIEQ